jgi:dimethylglycine dehydrogenase
MKAGADFDIRLIGMHAMDSMRLEKGYLAWKSEMNVHHTPLETNVAWTVKMDKEFIGKKGLEKQKKEGFPGNWCAWWWKPQIPIPSGTTRSLPVRNGSA